MKRIYFVSILCGLATFFVGCGKPSADPRVNVASGVGSDTLADNLIVRPIGQIFSALIGEGIEVQQATLRRNAEGFLELQVAGYNRSWSTRRFDYLVEWLDKDGMVIPAKTSVWQHASVQPKSPFAIRAIAPTPDAVDFRMNTRKQPK